MEGIVCFLVLVERWREAEELFSRLALGASKAQALLLLNTVRGCGRWGWGGVEGESAVLPFHLQNPDSVAEASL